MNDLSNYMLYNFHDSPVDLFQRMYLNVKLNEELKIRIYSFPMRFQPTDLPDRSHIGPKWNRFFLRSVQLVLQATHGVVSGEPDFFKAAFGATQDEFEDILSRPHHMIFNRQWYERYEGRDELEDYRASFRRLSTSERMELLAFVSAHNPAQYESNLRTLPANVRAVARAYVPLEREREREIQRIQRIRLESERSVTVNLRDEEIVEDAGLEGEELVPALTTGKSKRKRRAA
jgi:hypothetical protein